MRRQTTDDHEVCLNKERKTKGQLPHVGQIWQAAELPNHDQTEDGRNGVRVTVKRECDVFLMLAIP